MSTLNRSDSTAMSSSLHKKKNTTLLDGELEEMASVKKLTVKGDELRGKPKLFEGFTGRLSYYCEVMLAHPHIIAITLLILSVLCASGLCLIFFVYNSEEEDIREEALDLAMETGQFFSNQLDRAILPLFSMAQFVSELSIFHELPDTIGIPFQPDSLPFKPMISEERGYTHRNVSGVCDEPVLVDRFTEIATTIKRNAKMEGVLVNLQLAPYAVVCLIHPLNNTEDFEPPAYLDNSGAVGHDLLTDKNRKFIAEATVPSDSVVIAGPLKLVQCQDCNPIVEQAFIARLPISMEGKNIPLDGINYEKWGFTVALINWAALIGQSDIHIVFEDRGFDFQLTRTDRVDGNEKVVVLAQTSNFVYKRDTSVTVSLDTTNNEWEMTVVYDSDDLPQWKFWAVAATIVFSLIISFLACTILIQQQNYTRIEKKYMEDLAHPQKLRLQMFLEETSGQGPTREVEEVIREEKPIADLFPHTTLLFADIAGFTAWASEREPTQVFTLLQAIFYAFDRIAQKREVFKVETIGDSYLAVTGLPKAQPDHAVRMTKFARECMIKMNSLVRILETTLGPDTADLGCRFGLHSGPVTAGVLVGQRSRLQLFGDTVNTAARIESTGERNRIHLSQKTADLLIAAGKGKWVLPRDQQVLAKGKGNLQTYWFNARENSVSSKRRHNSSGGPIISDGTTTPLESDDDDNSSFAMSDVGSASNYGSDDLWAGEDVHNKVFGNIKQSSDSEKVKRLVEWQVDSMVKLLKQIVAKRGKGDNMKSNNNNGAYNDLVDPSKTKEFHATVLDEVKEVITLPKFDNNKNSKKQQSPESVWLNPVVISQLHDYVSSIAKLYRSNPFHNFEHAAHVTMSVHKLLNRIVTPEEVNYKQQNAKAIAADMHTYTFGITSDPLTHFAVVFSALIHDVDHTGVSNGQLAVEHPELAKKYRDQSIAEQNSVDIAWDILMDTRYKELQQCIFVTQTDLDRFRQLVVNVVLATDIFDRELKALRNARWDKAFHPAREPSELSFSAATQTSSEERELEELKWHDTNRKATIVIEHIIQASDVAHTMQHWHIYKKWNERLFQEMYVAWKMGRSARDPTDGWYKGELWFFDNYIIPLAKKLEECGVFGVASDECLFNALENRREWAIKGEEIVAEMKSKCQAMRLGAVPVAVKEDDHEEASQDC